MTRVDLNKKRPGMSNISENLMKAAQDKVSSNPASVFSDNTVAKDVSNMLKLDDSAPTKYIHRDLIYPNKLNVPYMEGITEDDFMALKASIMDIGLMHNLVVIEDGNGRYRLLSGEKRWQAINKMTEEEYNKALNKGIEAKVLPYNPNLTEDDELIMLLTCNVLVFSSGTPEPKQMRDLIRLYQKKGYEKKELVEFLNFYLKNNKQTIYKIVAESNATDELYELYSKKILVRSALQILGDLSPEDQHTICDKIRYENIEKVDEETASSLKRMLKEGKKKNSNHSYDTTIQYAKFEKAFNNASADLAKAKKSHFSNMNSTELSLSISKLQNLSNEIEEIKKIIEDVKTKAIKK